MTRQRVLHPRVLACFAGPDFRGQAEVQVAPGRSYFVSWKRAKNGDRVAHVRGPLSFQRPPHALFEVEWDRFGEVATQRNGWAREAGAAVREALDEEARRNNREDAP